MNIMSSGGPRIRGPLCFFQKKKNEHHEQQFWSSKKVKKKKRITMLEEMEMVKLKTTEEYWGLPFSL